MTNYANIRYQPAAASTTTVTDMTALIALTGMSNGDQALVQATNKLYIYSGTGWYLIATIQNDAPSAITGVSGTYELAIDGTATTITAVSTDPEGFPLTWSYSASGLNSIATVSQTENVFTITPSTTEADAGTFSLTINATDGVNGAVSTSTNLSLNFMVIVTNSKYTTLLATAVDTSDNNNITDASTNNHSITVTGDVHAGTFSPYRSGGYSTYFDGSTDYIEHQGTFTLPAGTNANWTIECWVNLDQVNLNQGILRVSSTAANGNNDDIYFSEQNGYINVACKAGGINSATSNYTMSANVWHHIAMVKNNGTVYLYNNGVYCGSLSDSNDYSGYYYVYGGLYYSSSYCFAGYLTDFRISNTAKYTSGTSNITVPDERLSSDSSTLFLTCHLPYIADGSTNDHSLTVNGDVSIKPFSPYDYNEYSESVNGGSVYFDGSGDRITASTSNNFAIGSSEDFIIEAWIYPTNTSQGDFHLFGIHQATYNGGIYLDYFGSDFRVGDYGGGWDVRTTSTVTLNYNNWQHICASRTGNLIKIFFNGESLALSSQGEAHTNSYNAGAIAIGGNGVGRDFQGFISDIRFEKGTSRTSNFTPPTAPLSSSGAELHIKGTDASIIDKSQSSNLQLIGNTTGSTTEVKFADTKSMYFDGTTDYIISQEPVLLGTQDFTAECWVYYQSGLELMGNRTVSDSGGFSIRMTSTSLTVGNSSGTGFGSVFSGTTSSLTNAWHHIAVSRSSGITKIYVDGSSIASHSSAINFSLSNPFVLGYAYTDGSGADSLQGYIQDFRITNGLARYTANFTPPTEPLKG